jgi:cytochrome c peroxidase
VRRRLAALLLGAAAPLSAAAPAGALLAFTAAEHSQIAAHGPWPPPRVLDAGNAHAARPQVIALGERLFFDARLSPDGRFACATCHVPALALADGRARAAGREALARNTPTLWNAVHERWLGWGGAADSLWHQSIHALTAVDEMAATPQTLHARVQGDAALACHLRAAFGRAAGDTPEATMVLLAKAIGAYVGTLVSPRTPFDRFRDALRRGDLRAAARYPAEAQRGLRLFIGRGRCSVCHGGPLFSHGEFGDIGLPFFARPGVVDAGRHEGIGRLRASPYHLLGPWSDDRDGAAATKTRHLDGQHRNFGEFKVPSLRNAVHTAPYMHDGQLATLEDVVRHYSELDPQRLHADGQRILEPLRLAPAEAADLVAFLKTLSGAAPPAMPPARAPARCPA